MTPNSERVVVVKNPASSRVADVQRNVIDRLTEGGYHPVELITPSANGSEIIDAVSNYIRPGDNILVAAGDGTGNAVANAYMQTKSYGAKLGFLPYGNFNDMAGTFSDRRVRKDPGALLRSNNTVDLKPLDVLCNGVHYRYAVLYASIGWAARAAGLYDDPLARRALQHGRANLPASLYDIAKMYFRTRQSSVLPSFSVAGEADSHARTTDVLAINGSRTAKIIRDHRSFYETDVFLRLELDVTSFVRNRKLLGRSALNLLLHTGLDLPGSLKQSDESTFQNATIPLQVDGEYTILKGVNRLSISKNCSSTTKTIKIMTTNVVPEQSC